MLSILIPTFNYDCTKLVGDLDRQCRAMKEAEDTKDFLYEIIVADDASTNRGLAEKNRRFVESIGMRFEALEINVGRAKIRNLLIDMAQYDYCILMDCDAAVCDDGFIRSYWDNRDAAMVVCGTLRNPPGPEPAGCELRYRYEHAADKSRELAEKRLHPYEQFSTFNFLCHRDVFNTVRFNEICTKYGYEDTFFGLMLKEKGISVVHIDNPLFHEGIDNNVHFLSKTEMALDTLRRLSGPFQPVAGAARVEKRLKRWKLAWAVRLVFPLLKGVIKKNLLGHSPSLFWFKIYKAGYYICCTDRYKQ